ncbi:MAG: YihY/virulence factor BrkB family protein [Terriglobia bacterium]
MRSHGPAKAKGRLTLARIVSAIINSIRRGCLLQAQGVAFAMFLAFFPALVFLVGIFVGSAQLTPALEDMLEGLKAVLPPGSRQPVLASLAQLSARPLQLLVLGFVATVFLGSGFMLALNRAFTDIYDTTETRSFWRRQGLAMGLVLLTVVPWVFVTLLVMFGKQVRTWLLLTLGREFGPAIRTAWTLGYFTVAILTALFVLALLYYVLVPNQHHHWRDVLPGAALALALWWIVTSAFGFYVRKLAVYSLLYGGFAATIGLLVWMYLSAIVVLMGAQFNADLARARSPAKVG